MRGFANGALSRSERVERIEERAEAFGASARSLSWLLPLGVVRLAPDVAGGMSSPAGDPISSSAPVIVWRRLGRPPDSRFAVQCCSGRAIHGQHHGQLPGVRRRGAVRGRQPGRRRGSGHGLGFPLCLLCRQELSPGRSVPAAVSSRIAAGALHLSPRRRSQIRRRTPPQWSSWSTRRSIGSGRIFGRANPMRVLAAGEHGEGCEQVAHCCRLRQWRSAPWR